MGGVCPQQKAWKVFEVSARQFLTAATSQPGKAVPRSAVRVFSSSVSVWQEEKITDSKVKSEQKQEMNPFKAFIVVLFAVCSNASTCDDAQQLVQFVCLKF